MVVDMLQKPPCEHFKLLKIGGDIVDAVFNLVYSTLPMPEAGLHIVFSFFVFFLGHLVNLLGLL